MVTIQTPRIRGNTLFSRAGPSLRIESWIINYWNRISGREIPIASPNPTLAPSKHFWDILFRKIISIAANPRAATINITIALFHAVKIRSTDTAMTEALSKID
jgi:hypothetical protein